jgi:hypothetical protein
MGSFNLKAGRVMSRAVEISVGQSRIIMLSTSCRHINLQYMQDPHIYRTIFLVHVRYLVPPNMIFSLLNWKFSSITKLGLGEIGVG